MGRKIPKIITSEEYAQLLQAMDKLKFQRISKKKIQEYKIAFILGTEAGLRISEIVGLKETKSRCCSSPIIDKIIKKGDKKLKLKFCIKCEKELLPNEVIVDKNKWKIKPLAQENINNRRLEIRNAKGGKDRILGLPSRLTDKHIKMLPLNIQRRALQKFATDLAKRVLNKHITFHTLRHSFATQFQRATGDINTLKTLMGHSSINTTAIYAHVSPDDAIKKQMEVFGGGA